MSSRLAFSGAGLVAKINAPLTLRSCVRPTTCCRIPCAHFLENLAPAVSPDDGPEGETPVSLRSDWFYVIAINANG